jgi:hypothetical protein
MRYSISRPPLFGNVQFAAPLLSHHHRPAKARRVPSFRPIQKFFVTTERQVESGILPDVEPGLRPGGKSLAEMSRPPNLQYALEFRTHLQAAGRRLLRQASRLTPLVSSRRSLIPKMAGESEFRWWTRHRHMLDCGSSSKLDQPSSALPVRHQAISIVTNSQNPIKNLFYESSVNIHRTRVASEYSTLRRVDARKPFV